MTTAAPPRLRTFPVVEVFGPTVQGEGPDAGQACYFVRLGGCDYRCSWCDSMYAVDPGEVRQAERLTASAVVSRLAGLRTGPRLVVLSGGNPALHHAAGLLRELHAASYRVSVETQGSVWRPWLERVDRLVVSPKPPSSGMATPAHDAKTARFMHHALGQGVARRTALKIVVFDAADYEWAIAFHLRHHGLPCYLSVGTPQADTTTSALRDVLCDQYAWLAETVAHDPRAQCVRVLPQMHVLAWGAARGV